jgi:transcriptional regulator with XRE-family HTH domain
VVVNLHSIPTVRRRRLAKLLKLSREANDLTIEEASTAADISKSQLSRIENYQVPANPNTVKALIGVYKIKEPDASFFLELARDSKKSGWWQGYGEALTDQMSTYIAFESEASGLSQYQDNVVPGILQTEGYARALFRSARPAPREDVLESRVEMRIRRQDRLPELNVWWIIGEGVLKRNVGGPAVMREQLKRLLATREMDITLQVLPYSVGATPGIESSFTILHFAEGADLDIVYAETVVGEVYVDDETAVEEIRSHFNYLRAEALGAAASYDRISRELSSLG